MSSCAEEEDRTTNARSSGPAGARHAERTASSPVAAPGARSAGTSTTPGSTGGPATAARTR
ncbi:hypothetical protein [Streptomyces shaanxiensis]